MQCSGVDNLTLCFLSRASKWHAAKMTECYTTIGHHSMHLHHCTFSLCFSEKSKIETWTDIKGVLKTDTGFCAENNTHWKTEIGIATSIKLGEWNINWNGIEFLELEFHGCSHMILTPKLYNPNWPLEISRYFSFWRLMANKPSKSASNSPRTVNGRAHVEIRENFTGTIILRASWWICAIFVYFEGLQCWFRSSSNLVTTK